MRITEVKLRQIIRMSLLTEAARTPLEAAEEEISFQIKRAEDKIQIDALIRGMFRVGEIMAVRVTGIKCREAWQVRLVESEPGLGPLLYDLMMDLVSPHPLTADRETVSKYALNVWKYYLKHRPDIGSLQLDDPMDTLTPEADDNCYQDSSMEWSKSRWPKSPLSKAYYRLDGETPTLDSLTELGAVIYI